MLAWYGGTVIISFHEGGTLRLLALMTLATSAIWICQYTLYSRMVLCRAALVLPLVAAVRLASGRSVCRRQLSTLGAAGVAPPPLAALHSGLGWAHLATRRAVALLPLPATPLDQCVAIYGWLELVLGVLLPLVILAALEQRSRRLFAAWRARRGAPASQPPQQHQHQHAQLQPWPGWQLAAMLTGSSQVGGGAVWRHQPFASQPEAEAEAETIQRPLAWGIHFYLLSCLTWAAANALALWV